MAEHEELRAMLDDGDMALGYTVADVLLLVSPVLRERDELRAALENRQTVQDLRAVLEKYGLKLTVTDAATGKGDETQASEPFTGDCGRFTSPDSDATGGAPFRAATVKGE